MTRFRAAGYRFALHTLAATGLLASISLAGAAHAGGGLCPCAHDLNASGGIDAADLAVLLGAWGQSNVAADLNGSGLVDASDLSILLGAWGACAGPANDNCGDALLMPVAFTQDINFCTLTATTDGPAHALCDIADTAQIGQDIWYHFTAPTTGVFELDTCASDFDTRLAVYGPGFLGTLCPAPFFGAAILGCNDDVERGACVSNGLASALAVDVDAGVTYAVRLGGFVSEAGSGVLHTNFRPQGDLCSEAIHVHLADPGAGDGVTIIHNGDTLHTTASSPNADVNSCGGEEDVKDLWFRVTIDCQSGGMQPVQLSASTCMPGTDFDTTLTLFKGDDCANLVEVECNDDSGLNGCLLGGLERKSFVSISSLDTTETYWVRLAGFNGDSGEYEIKFFFRCF